MAIRRRDNEALSELIPTQRYQRQNVQKVEEQSSNSFSNNSSIMNILPNDDDKSGLFFDKTCKPVAPDDRSSLWFWFKRSDFYIVGLDFVFCRIALICQSTAITFYLVEVCGYVSTEEKEIGKLD